MSDTNPATHQQSQTAVLNERESKQLPPWNVVLLDTDDHTYEYVIRMMQNLFGHTAERAMKIAETVDKDGRAVCLTTHKELAELKRDQVHAFGPDPLSKTAVGSMSALIEPAEFSSDDADDHT